MEDAKPGQGVLLGQADVAQTRARCEKKSEEDETRRMKGIGKAIIIETHTGHNVKHKERR